MLYEKAFQKGLWEAVRAEKAYAPLLSALLEDYRAVSREGPVSAVRFSEYIIYQETGSRKNMRPPILHGESGLIHMPLWHWCIRKRGSTSSSYRIRCGPFAMNIPGRYPRTLRGEPGGIRGALTCSVQKQGLH